MSMPVVAIFDIGKTNKKCFLLDENYQIVFEKNERLDESVDEDGFRCEDLVKLRLFVDETMNEIFNLEAFSIRAINFSTYGASLVYLDRNGRPLTPLYNYLKPYPKELSKQFYNAFGSEEEIALQTCSPALGSLNAGLQLYRLKQEQPALFQKLFFALHLPQYMSFLLTGRYFSDITSIGCHTMLWDFNKKDYHVWVGKENLKSYLAPIEKMSTVIETNPCQAACKIGIGIHDSSAALIPYLQSFSKPFILISTGTWSVSMNPFNKNPLTPDELKNDCLCYLQYNMGPVKASRFHIGPAFEKGVQRIAEYFHQDILKYNAIQFDPAIAKATKLQSKSIPVMPGQPAFEQWDPAAFTTDTEAYYQLLNDLIVLQYSSTKRIMGESAVKKIFVDGGFSRNDVFMHLLAAAFSPIEVYAALMAQASTIAAALAIQASWNSKPVPDDMIQLRYFPPGLF